MESSLVQDESSLYCDAFSSEKIRKETPDLNDSLENAVNVGNDAVLSLNDSLGETNSQQEELTQVDVSGTLSRHFEETTVSLSSPSASGGGKSSIQAVDPIDSSQGSTENIEPGVVKSTPTDPLGASFSEQVTKETSGKAAEEGSKPTTKPGPEKPLGKKIAPTFGKRQSQSAATAKKKTKQEASSGKKKFLEPLKAPSKSVVKDISNVSESNQTKECPEAHNNNPTPVEDGCDGAIGLDTTHNDSNGKQADQNQPPSLAKTGKIAMKAKPFQGAKNTADSENHTPKESDSLASKKQQLELKKQEREQKQKEREEKKIEQEQKKKEREQKRLELEQKKLEREQEKERKKHELELKKNEREQKKQDQEVKKQEREQKKQDEEVKKQEREQEKQEHDQKKQELKQKSQQSESERKCDKVAKQRDVVIKETLQQDEVIESNEPPTSCQLDEEMEEVNHPADLDVLEAKCDSTPEHIDDCSMDTSNPSSDVANSESIVDGNPAESSQSKSMLGDEFVENAKDCQDCNSDVESAGDTTDVDSPKKTASHQGSRSPKEIHPEQEALPAKTVGGNTEANNSNVKTKVTSKSSPPQQKSSKVDGISKPKAFSAPVKSTSAAKSSEKASRKRQPGDSKATKPPPAKQTKIEGNPSNKKKEKIEAKTKPKEKVPSLSGPVWVQCEECGKWRVLQNCLDPSLVPENWTCKMNPDPGCNSCPASEVNWPDLPNSQEFIYSQFSEGSIVWAKIPGYPWWPGMIESDPDMDACMSWDDDNPSDVTPPDEYHIVYFGNPVSRAWVPASMVQSFDSDGIPPEKEKAGAFTKAQKLAVKQAKDGLDITIENRLKTFSFQKRFRKSSQRKSSAGASKDTSMDCK